MTSGCHRVRQSCRECAGDESLLRVQEVAVAVRAPLARCGRAAHGSFATSGHRTSQRRSSNDSYRSCSNEAKRRNEEQ